jgi:hypothetical protein
MRRRYFYISRREFLHVQCWARSEYCWARAEYRPAIAFYYTFISKGTCGD